MIPFPVIVGAWVRAYRPVVTVSELRFPHLSASKEQFGKITGLSMALPSWDRHFESAGHKEQGLLENLQ
jgi:hypothetical protein